MKNTTIFWFYFCRYYTSSTTAVKVVCRALDRTFVNFKTLKLRPTYIPFLKKCIFCWFYLWRNLWISRLKRRLKVLKMSLKISEISAFIQDISHFFLYVFLSFLKIFWKSFNQKKLKQFIEPKTFDNRMDSFHLHPFFFSPMEVAEFFFHLEGWKDVEIPEDLIIQLWLTLISFLGCHGSKSNVLLSWMCQFDFSLQEPKSIKDRLNRLNIHIFWLQKINQRSVLTLLFRLHAK